MKRFKTLVLVSYCLPDEIFGVVFITYCRLRFVYMDLFLTGSGGGDIAGSTTAQFLASQVCKHKWLVSKID